MADVLSISLGSYYQEQFGVVSKTIKDIVGPAEGAFIRCPLKMSYAGDSMYNPDSWQLPFEPIISVRGQNTIIRNHVLKNQELGTVKELWSADDWEISISGIVIGKDPKKLPEAEINRLRWFFQVRRTIEVDSPYLALFGIQYIAIESVDFPPTSGYNNQAYTYKAFSDKPFEL